MTGRKRLLTALGNEQPDHVPAAPDLFEMVPIRLSKGPSWNSLVYQDPPVWKARVDACTHFAVDAFIPLVIPMPNEPKMAVVYRSEEKLITRTFTEEDGKRCWAPVATVYAPKEPSAYVQATAIGLPETHDDYEIVKPNYSKVGREHLEDAREYLGEQGVIAPMTFLPCLGSWEDDIYKYYDDPDACAAQMRAAGEAMMEQSRTILSWKPDVLMIGNSGMMLFNPVPIFREISLEWLQKVTKLAKEHGILTHLHCCGPERDLVEIAANESDLSSIEPLEIPPMGDCELKEVKQQFGSKLALKGNLHTTNIMWQGTAQEVEEACKKAIDDAALGGGFILSTGDQTPRDAPDENIRTMQRVAETYGRY